MNNCRQETDLIIPDLEDQVIVPMNSNLKSDRQIRRALENLQLSADAKSILHDLTQKAVQAGKQIIYIGRAILTFALDIIKISPTSAFGAIVGALISSLIVSVPVLGGLLGSVLGPLLLAFGIGMGALSDALAGDIRNRVDEFVTRYRPLTA